MKAALPLTFASVALTVYVTTVASAAAPVSGDTSIAVLGLEASGQATTFAQELTTALRQRVAATRGYTLVSGKDMVEVKLVFGCTNESASCMAQAAKSMGAAKLIFGSLRKSEAGGRFVVAWKYLDASTAKIESRWTEEITGQASPAVIQSWSQKWFAALTGQPLVGSIDVRTGVAGASVLLDGREIVTTNSKGAALLTNVPIGEHLVSVQKAGYGSASNTATVTPGATVALSAVLEPNQAAAPTQLRDGEDLDEETDESGASRARVGFWVTFGATAISAAAAVKFGLDVKQANEDLDPYRRYPCPGQPDNVSCTEDGSPAMAWDADYVREKQDEGERAELLQWVFVGIGSACAVTSAYFFYRGYLAEEIASEDVARLSKARRQEKKTSLLVTPVVTPDAGHMFLRLQF